MIEVLNDHYKSKSDVFLIPLTGLKKDGYKVQSFMFWRDYSIEDFNLVLKYEYKNYDEFLDYARNQIFPKLNKYGYLLESYDFEGYSLLILDISEWALDIEILLMGKYSKFSQEAKTMIEAYHMLPKKSQPIDVWAALYPNKKANILDGLTPIEYVALHYGLDLESLQKLGEVGSLYDKESETLKENARLTLDSKTD